MIFHLHARHHQFNEQIKFQVLNKKSFDHWKHYYNGDENGFVASGDLVLNTFL